MNYELEISKSRPSIFNNLNGGVPPLVAGSGSATKLTTELNTAFVAFNNGYEDTPFSLEVWFLPLTNTGEHTVIGHQTEGVLWDGTRFILRVRQGTSTVTESTWTPPEIKAFHVVMVYTKGQVFLYVDGEIVALLDLSIDTFTSTGAGIKINGGTATGIYDSLALYYRALRLTEVREHYRWGNDVMTAQQVAMLKGGTTWSLSYEDVSVAERFLFDASNFALGYTDNVMVTNNLVTSTDAVGIWRQSIVLSTLVGATIPGIHLTYEGSGVTMSYSTDGVTWTPVANKTTILQDVAVVDILFIQLQLADEDSWVSYLRADVLAERKMSPLSGSRYILFRNTAMDQTPGSQTSYQADSGASVFRSNGYLSIPREESVVPQTMGTVEMWVKLRPGGTYSGLFDSETSAGAGGPFSGISGGTLTGGGAGYAAYVNGAASGYTLTPGVWYHVVLTFTPGDYKHTLGTYRDLVSVSDVNFGHVALYPQKMTASEVSKLYAFNTGFQGIRVDDTSGITVSESVPGVSIYAYSWSYVSGGR